MGAPIASDPYLSGPRNPYESRGARLTTTQSPVNDGT
ncbi:hypothetical protein LMG29542_06423 [Paraburkholderia humisilvae]|uniref:Uncharacterized protein n=1 Tax=Paraburkholderia humisilvae TaxID=627669 RepID=A0A6J5EZ36_9BURK|nr:hypothetical protein LMG29542_06423 [Paraburkholderia humisilvae]